MTAQSGLGFSGIAAIQIPDMGATGEVLTKLTPDDYDYDWQAVAGGFAPDNAEYVVMSLDPTLTDERVLTAGTGMNIVDGGAGGAVTLNVDLTLQEAYDNDTTVPQITINATPDPLTIDASVAGDIFAVRDTANLDWMRVATTGHSIGRSGRRHRFAEQVDSTGRFGTEVYPDSFSITTATGVQNMVFYTQSTRTITLNIPGGGGVGNDTAPGGFNFTHTADFLDTGFLFAAQLLINAAVLIRCSTATVGPLYLFLDQYNTQAATGQVATCTQHNTIRSQPRWSCQGAGANITQTSLESLFLAATVDATGGAAASITTINKVAIKGVTLTGGGTVGTYNGIDIVNIVGPTTIRGIHSIMDNGDFILHSGDAPVRFTSAVFEMDFVDNAAIVLGTGDDVEISWDGSSLDVLFALNSDILELTNPAVNNIRFDMTGTGGLNFNTDEVVFGTGLTADGTNNWQAAFAPGAVTVTLGGDFSRRLFSAGGGATVDAALSNAFTDTINEPFLIIGTGSVVNAGNMLIQTAPSVGTNRYGLLITSNPSGGTLNYAFRQSNASALARFDGRLDINRGIALGGGAAATLGTIGGAGPTAAAQAQWCEIDIGGVAHWIPVWT